MPWYGWLLLAVLILLVVCAITFRIVRSTARGRRFLRLSTRGKLRCARVLLKDRRVPLVSKAILIVVTGYLLLPFDLIPDFIPVVGQLDDILIVIGALALLLLVTPGELLDAAMENAEQADASRNQERGVSN